MNTAKSNTLAPESNRMKIALPLAALAMTITPLASQADPITDSFDTLANWSTVTHPNNGYWALQDGTLEGVSYTTSSLGADMMLNQQPSADFIASVQFTGIAGSAYGEFGMLQRLLGADYKFVIGVGSDSAAGAQSSLNWWVRDMNPNTHFAEGWHQDAGGAVALNWDPDAWNTASLTKTGSLYSIYFNDALIGNWNDRIWGDGGSFTLHSHSVTRYDNFAMRDGSYSVPDEPDSFLLLGIATMGLLLCHRLRQPIHSHARSPR